MYSVEILQSHCICHFRYLTTTPFERVILLGGTQIGGENLVTTTYGRGLFFTASSSEPEFSALMEAGGINHAPPTPSAEH